MPTGPSGTFSALLCLPLVEFRWHLQAACRAESILSLSLLSEDKERLSLPFYKEKELKKKSQLTYALYVVGYNKTHTHNH